MAVTAIEVSEKELSAYRQRRERELSSLYATTRSLTALGEIDDVLELIVRHAHDLVGTDITYLSLVGPDGELTLRASAGTISADFRSAHVPSGIGIGGRVIASGSPAWVSNYLAARDLPHDPSFDLLVNPEGLVALLGVPLLVGDEVIGVLFAADRSERPFASDEVALLSAFADHAAIALNNARLYEQSREALQELQAAYRTMERAQSVHEALTDVVLTGGGPDEVAQHLAEHLNGDVAVLGRDGTVLARSGDRTAPEAADAAIPDTIIDAARRSRRCVTRADGDVFHSVATIQAGDSHLGAVALSSRHQPTMVDERIMERATHVLGLLILKENAIADAAERLSGELMTELLVSSPVVGPTQRARLQARGIDPDRLDYVVVADSPTLSTTELSRRLHSVAVDLHGLAGEYLGRPTMLVCRSGEDTARAVHQRLRRAFGRPVTVIGHQVRGTEWGAAFVVASRCTAVAQALGCTDLGADAAQYAVYGALFDPERAEDLSRFLRDRIGPLLDYDERKATDLVATLTSYYEHGGNLTHTARAMHIHQNTVLKRLDRVGALLGPDWRSPHQSLELQLALRLHSLRTAVALAP
jgi:hypothetical protein